MKKIVALAFATLALGACGSSSSEEPTATSDSTSETVLYATLDYGDGCIVSSAPDDALVFLNDEAEAACDDLGFFIEDNQLIMKSEDAEDAEADLKVEEEEEEEEESADEGLIADLRDNWAIQSEEELSTLCFFVAANTPDYDEFLDLVLSDDGPGVIVFDNGNTYEDNDKNRSDLWGYWVEQCNAKVLDQ